MMAMINFFCFQFIIAFWKKKTCLVEKMYQRGRKVERQRDRETERDKRQKT